MTCSVPDVLTVNERKGSASNFTFWMVILMTSTCCDVLLLQLLPCMVQMQS